MVDPSGSRPASPPRVVVARHNSANRDHDDDDFDRQIGSSRGTHFLSPSDPQYYSPQQSSSLFAPRRESSATTANTLSIASYYYRNPEESYDRMDSRQPSAEMGRPATSTSARNAGHRAGSEPGAALSLSTSGRDIFAGWSDTFQDEVPDHERSASNDGYGARRQELLTNAFQLSADDSYEGQTSIDPRTAVPTHDRRTCLRHLREVSSATDGDVGIGVSRTYGHASPLAAESMQTLDLDLDDTHLRPSPLSSLPNTPMNDLSDQPGSGRYFDDSELAGLTTNSANIGWSHAGVSLVQSPESNSDDISPSSRFDGERQRNYFNAAAATSRASLHEDVEENPRPHSSADLYNSFTGVNKEGDLSKARKGLDKLGKSFRRMSRRVVKLDEDERPAREGRIRLPDNDADSSDDDGNVFEMQQVPAKSAADDLRGKSLGIFGPTSSLRRALAKLMTQWWIEPVILCTIIFNAVVLVIQSAGDVFVQPRKPGYFDYWTDYALLGVFAVYTVEAVARIIVSGLLINPPALDNEIDPNASLSDIRSLKQRRLKARTSDPRANVMRSNTKDTFAALGESVKNKAAHALKPHQELHLGRSVSPNRQRAPRTVQSSHIYPSKSQATPHAPSGMPQENGLLHDKTSRFLQKTRLTPFAHAIVLQRAHAVDYAYLRHSWSRVDLVAIVSFWIAFLLGIFLEEQTAAHHIYVFHALSVLRVSRLLTVTHGTSVILRSLKTAAPILVNVAFFTAFSMLLFSVIGVQSFEGNYKRSCLWVGDLQTGIDYAPGTNYTLSQLCGGYIDSVSGEKMKPLNARGRPLRLSVKGYLCPQGQICMESSNPESGTQSFDNIFEALLQVVIVTSLNGWSTIMYNMIDADFFASCLYFIIGVIIMNFWMANLFVAVITNTFATISAETKQSAFAAERIEPAKPAAVEIAEPTRLARHRQRAASAFKRFWGYTKFFWLALIVADLGVQASQASYHGSRDNDDLMTAEFYLTIAFDAEILMRFFAFLLDNDWRSFFASRRNRFDLLLAVVTSVMQVPVIQQSHVYAWLTAFQLARFYRVIAAVPRMEALLIRVFGSMTGLFNMIMFLFMMVVLAALVAVQLFRGDIPQDVEGQAQEINFKTIYNSFLGMYQIFSSENWTTPLYSVLTAELAFKQAVIGGIFLGAWFLFANFIVLQMFVAVIAENFGVAESQKKAQQLELYLRRLEKPGQSWGVKVLNQLSPYRWLRERNAVMSGEQEKPHHGRELAEEALHKLDEKTRNRKSLSGLVTPKRAQHIITILRRALRLDRPEESVPLDTVRARHLRHSFSGASVLSPQRGASIYASNGVEFMIPPSNGETARVFARDRQLTRMRTGLGLVPEEGPNQAEIDDEHRNRWKDDPRIAQARLINTHPSYEKSLWLFSNTSSFRRSCQSFVPCSYGERLFGRRTSRLRLRAYQVLLFSAVAASVIIAGIATPKYRRSWYAKHGLRRDSWFSLAEIMLSIIFIIEFFVKVIADGFAFTPNAYLLSPWNALDLFVLVTLIVNVSTELAVIGGVSRFTRALKAFRALRLINLSTLMRRTFSGLVAGAGRFIDASVLAILYIVPFAIWGQNLFSGLLYSCTDTSPGILTKSDCLNEYSASPSQWSFLAPRVWQNPTQGSVYSFDDFRSSLLILFEIVSLEGWVNVMTAAMSITGYNNQLQTDSRQYNALFFVVYNLIGAIFVLTLFVAVIIESFQSFSGAAYQTAQQRQWIDLKRLIARQRPSKRPRYRPTNPVRSWCYDRATRKNGWWSRWMTLMFLTALVALATQTYGDRMSSEMGRDVLYIVVTCFYAADILIRLSGLGWRSYRQDAWNLFDLAVVTGTFATSIPLLAPNSDNIANLQVQKIFLVAMAFKLVQKNNALNQLFKTAVSSLPSIASLFLLWLTMFLTWGIMLVEVFGLTAWGINESYSRNFSTLLNSLVFLSMMSTGEGWNSYMHDYTLSPPHCTPAANYLNTDCGSVGYAYFLFISWNVISMYIFLNMFTGTVVENFSYVFQLGGKPTLSREQVRNFKQAWAEFDTGRTGYIARENFVRFFNKLEGSLELRVHPRGAEIKTLTANAMAAARYRRSMESSASTPSSPLRDVGMRLRLPGLSQSHDAPLRHSWSASPVEGPIVAGMSISALFQQLDALDHDEIRRRRDRFEHVYHEALLISELPKNRAKGGISFQDMLLLVAHYKLIDEHALSVAELIERRDHLQHVEDRIETERVRGLLRLMWLRRRFLAMRQEHQRLQRERRDEEIRAYKEASHTGTVPEITIEHASREMSYDKSFSSARPALRLDIHGVPSHTTPDARTTQHASTSQLPSRTQILREAEGNDGRPSIQVTTTDDDSLIGDEKSMRKADAYSDRDHSSYVPSLHSSYGDASREYAGQLSRSSSMREIEMRASPIIQEIDESAWGALARRLPEENVTATAASPPFLHTQSQTSLQSRRTTASAAESLWGAATAAARRMSGSARGSGGSSHGHVTTAGSASSHLVSTPPLDTRSSNAHSATAEMRQVTSPTMHGGEEGASMTSASSVRSRFSR